MTKVGIVAVGLALAALVPMAGAQERQRKGQPNLADLPPILRQAAQKQGSLRFSGVRVMEFRRGPERRRHEEVILRDGDRLRIEFPDDSPFKGQVIVEDGRTRRHFFPDRNEIRVLPARRDEGLIRMLRGRGREGRERPAFRPGGVETVAGVQAETLIAKDGAGNPLQKIWIHARSGLILKRELYDRTGAVVGLMEYRSVNFRPTFRPGDFEIRRAGARVVTPEDEARRLAKANGMTAMFLPESEGQLEFARVLQPQGRSILMQVYQTPQGPLSLYQVVGDLNRRALRREGARQFQSYAWKQGGMSLALVGARSESELAEIAARIRER